MECQIQMSVGALLVIEVCVVASWGVKNVIFKVNSLLWGLGALERTNWPRFRALGEWELGSEDRRWDWNERESAVQDHSVKEMSKAGHFPSFLIFLHLHTLTSASGSSNSSLLREPAGWELRIQRCVEVYWPAFSSNVEGPPWPASLRFQRMQWHELCTRWQDTLVFLSVFTFKTVSQTFLWTSFFFYL